MNIKSVLIIFCLLCGVSKVFAQSNSNDALKNYIWDLSSLFANDESWENERVAIEQKINTIGKFKGTLGRDSHNLLIALDEVADLRRRAGKMAVFGVLSWSVDTVSEKTQRFHEVGTTLETRVEGAISFVEDEIRAMGAKRFADFMRQEPILKTYQRRVHQILREAPHLPPAEIKPIVESMRRWQQLPDLTYWSLRESNAVWSTIKNKEGKEIILNPSVYLQLRRSADKDLQKIAVSSHLERLNGLADIFALLLTRRMEAENTIAKYRNFKDGIESFLFRDGFPLTTRQVFVKTTRDNLPTFHRYLKLRKQINKLDRMTFTDLFNPLPSITQQFSVAQSMEIIMAASVPLGIDFQARLQERLKKTWYHLAQTPHKRDLYGVYYSIMSRGNPFLIQTYRNDFASSMELAGGVFAIMLFADVPNNPGPETRHDPPIFANTFSEAGRMLHNDYVKDHASTRQQRIDYLIRALDDFRSRYFRIVIHAEFESQVNDLVIKGEILNGARVSEIYLKLLREYYGHNQNIVNVDESYSADWITFTNFFYGFDTQGFPLSTAAATSLVERVKTGDPKARQAFSSLLERGESDLSHDLLKQAGVDLTTDESYKAIFRRMNALMDELEELVKEEHN